ncbi:hypothetical protein CR513_09907, partial [Mucuna pruriens]
MESTTGVGVGMERNSSSGDDFVLSWDGEKVDTQGYIDLLTTFDNGILTASILSTKLSAQLNNADLFALCLPDMPGIDPKYLSHKLVICAHAKPTSQRKRKLDEERRQGDTIWAEEYGSHVPEVKDKVFKQQIVIDDTISSSVVQEEEKQQCFIYFTNQVLQGAEKRYQVTSIKHPQTNGQAEATNKVILKDLKKGYKELRNYR